MLFENAFNKASYIDGKRLNYWFLGAMLNSLSSAQHLYDRHDIAELYHFIGDIIDNGDFEWGGTNRLTKPEKCATVQTKDIKSGKSPLDIKTQLSLEDSEASQSSEKKASKK